MWSWSLGAMSPPRGRREEELSRYAKMEYGSRNFEWMLSSVSSRRHHRFRRLVGAWIRRLSRAGRNTIRRVDRTVARSGADERQFGAPPAAPSQRASLASGVDRPDLQEACGHYIREYLGSGGSTSYYRCLGCWSILAAQGGREIFILSDRHSESQLDETVADSHASVDEEAVVEPLPS